MNLEKIMDRVGFALQVAPALGSFIEQLKRNSGGDVEVAKGELLKFTELARKQFEDRDTETRAELDKLRIP